MVSFNLKVLAKFGLCSNCSQKFDGCSLARAGKIFATACQMLVYTPLWDVKTKFVQNLALLETRLHVNFVSNSLKVALYVGANTVLWKSKSL